MRSGRTANICATASGRARASLGTTSTTCGRIRDFSAAHCGCSRTDSAEQLELDTARPEDWLGGLDSNQDSQLQRLMYCRLYDLPAEGENSDGPCTASFE